MHLIPIQWDSNETEICTNGTDSQVRDLPFADGSDIRVFVVKCLECGHPQKWLICPVVHGCASVRES